MTRAGASYFPTNSAAWWMAQRHPRPDPADPHEVFKRIERLRSTGEQKPQPPASGSELSRDDEALDPYMLSHAVSLATGIATDNLEAIRALIVDAGRTQPWAQYSLIRAALENATTALWLIGPDNPKERRYRRLRLAWNDVHEGEAARALLPKKPAEARSLSDREKQLRALAPDGRDIAGRWSYRTPVRGAAEYLGAGTTADALEVAWRAYSGLSHGKWWATLSMLERKEEPGYRDGEMNARLTTSVEQLVPPMALTVQVVRAARALLTRRGAS